MVSGTSPCAIGLPAADTQRETAWPLPVLRPPDELSLFGEVRLYGTPHLASVVGSQDARRAPLLAAFRSPTRALPLAAPAHHPCLEILVNLPDEPTAVV